jgi:eukaryotic-like serine/threonine-protein kinase
MEYVEGTDLGKLVRLAGPLPPEVASEYIRQAALGLQHAHERNLIHRDIKPVNLILTNPPENAAELLARRNGASAERPPLIKILDWGLASLRPPSRKGDSGLGGGGAILGTADYLSPEQARNADAADIRSDIYSLGCTHYYLLTGQPPFPGHSLGAKLIQHQTAEPAPLEQFNPAVTPALASVVKRMMAKKPEERYQTPAAIALALKVHCRKPVGAPAATPAQPAARAPVTPRPGPASEQTRVADDTPMPTSLAPAGERTQAPIRPPLGRPPVTPQRAPEPRRS